VRESSKSSLRWEVSGLKMTLGEECVACAEMMLCREDVGLLELFPLPSYEGTTRCILISKKQDILLYNTSQASASALLTMSRTKC
jgi:hypothetical protein